MLDSRLFDDLETAFGLIPRKYKINIRINLRDLGDYSMDDAKDVVESNMALKVYSLGLRMVRKSKTNVIFIAIGVAILIISYALSHRNMPQILFDVVNITGTLFIWETVSSMFLEGQYERKEASRLASKLERIIICGPDGKEVDCKMFKRKQLFKKERA